MDTSAYTFIVLEVTTAENASAIAGTALLIVSSSATSAAATVLLTFPLNPFIVLSSRSGAPRFPARPEIDLYFMGIAVARDISIRRLLPISC